jgi:hypothetical protein
MTAAERTELGKLVRLRGKVAKEDIGAREARLVADFESKLAAEYSFDDAAWATITADAAQQVAEADAKIAERCRQMGVPENFRPSLHVSWYGRGENACRARRTELRAVARTEIAARGKQAKVEIDRHTAGLLTQLAEGALGTVEAQAFLAAMPSIEALMPALELAEAEAKAPLRVID